MMNIQQKALYEEIEMDAKLRDSSAGRCLKGQKGKTHSRVLYNLR